MQNKKKEAKVENMSNKFKTKQNSANQQHIRPPEQPSRDVD